MSSIKQLDKPHRAAGEIRTNGCRETALEIVVRRTLQPAEIEQLMEDCVRIAADCLGTSHCGIGMRTDGGLLNWYLCRLEKDNDFSDARKTTLSLDASRSLHGYALENARTVATDDLDTDDRFHDRLLGRCSLSSAIVTPLSHGDAEFGVIGVYDQRVREYTRSEKNLMESIGFILSMNASRLNSESKLQQQRDFNRTVLESIPALVLVLDSEGRIMQMNRACRQTTGFGPKEAEGRSFWSALLLPEDEQTVRESFDRMRKGTAPVPFETFVLTKLGDRRRVDWSFTISGQQGSADHCIIGTGVDVTDRFQLEGQLAEAQESISELNRSVDSSMMPKERSEQEKAVEEETERSSDSVGRDRHRHSRRTYPYIQIIAPMVDGQLPPLSVFKEMRCRDISPEGFSYVTSRPPEYTQVVIAFGAHPNLVYLTAEIRHMTPHEHDGRKQFLIGCSYTGRVAY